MMSSTAGSTADFNNSPFIRCNISGTIFLLTKHALKGYGRTRLGRIATLSYEDAKNLCDEYIPETMEFYFERCPVIFNSIASLYRTGQLHMPGEQKACPAEVMLELEYWQIEPQFSSLCLCSKALQLQQDNESNNNISRLFSLAEPEVPKLLKYGCREKLWFMVENPRDSWGGKVLALIYLFFLAFSTILIILSSYPEYGHPGAAGRSMPKGGNLTENQTLQLQIFVEWQNRFEIMKALHYATTAYFGLEFLARFYAAPSRCAFLMKPLSIIDIISLVPYIFVITFGAAGLLTKHLAEIRQIINVLRILRMLQLLRYARHLESFRLMHQALIDARMELGFLLAVVFTLVLILATVMYTVEYNVDDSIIKDIPTAMYWCFVTISTVGYGDVVPKGTVGKVLACFMTTLGVIFLSLPVSIIVSKFTRTYDQMNKMRSAKKSLISNNVSTELL